MGYAEQFDPQRGPSGAVLTYGERCALGHNPVAEMIALDTKRAAVDAGCSEQDASHKALDAVREFAAHNQCRQIRGSDELRFFTAGDRQVRNVSKKVDERVKKLLNEGVVTRYDDGMREVLAADPALKEAYASSMIPAPELTPYRTVTPGAIGRLDVQRAEGASSEGDDDGGRKNERRSDPGGEWHGSDGNAWI